MKSPRWRWLHLAISVTSVLLSIVFSDHNARSQAQRTIKLVVATPLGGPTDILAHFLADQVSRALGRAQGLMVVIENSPGADGVIGAEAVARAPADGNTLLMTGNAFVINPHLRQVYYDPLTSFEPICYLTNSPAVIVVNNTSPYRTLADLIDAARAKPGDLTMASFGPAGILHIGVEMLKRDADVNLAYVPYSGEIPAVNALVGGQVTAVIASYRGVAERLKAGTLRALAATSPMRIESLPGVPTVAQSGYKDYEAEARLWLFAPAKTPKETVAQLASWFTGVMQAPEVKSRLLVEGLNPVGMCGAEFRNFVQKQYDEYGRVIRGSKINVE